MASRSPYQAFPFLPQKVGYDQGWSGVKNSRMNVITSCGVLTREAVVELLLQHPVLMQRPIVIKEGRAVIARPSEKVIELLEP